MSDSKEGTLQLQPPGRWVICRPGERPHELNSGDLFRIEVVGELKVTRTEFWHFSGPLKGREYRGQSGEFYTVDDYPLQNGLRAAIGAV